MKELFQSLIFALALYGGGIYTLRKIHTVIQRAALEKAAQGLPSITEMNRHLTH